MRIWLDTEFNGWRGALISMALVAEDGREWYRSLGCEQPTPWVATHVMPVLRARRTTHERLQTSLCRWLRSFDRLHVIANWPEDFAHFCSVLVTGPGSRLRCPPLSMEMVEELEAHSTIPHNALEDARALRTAHLHRLANAGLDATVVGTPASFQRLLARVVQMVRESGDPQGFDAHAWLSAWLQTCVPALGWARPAEILEQPGGFDRVLALLLRMQSGTCS